MSKVKQYHWGGLRVPFVAPWSGEKSEPGRVVVRHGVGGTGIGYEDEVSQVDRRNGVLWVRSAATRGFGRPELAGMHPLRQRQAIAHMLCQVCGESTIGSRPDERHLFLVGAANGEPLAEGELTVSPPVHTPCALESVKSCRYLRRGYTAALVGYCPSWGVAGIEYDPETCRPRPAPSDDKDGLAYVAYDDPRIRWTLAARSVISLHGVTRIDLEELAAEEAATPHARPAAQLA